MPCGRIPLGLTVFGLALFSASVVTGQTLRDRQQELAVAQRLAQRAAQQAEDLQRQSAAEKNAAASAQLKSAAMAAHIQALEAANIAAQARLIVIRKLQEDVRARLAERQRPAIRLVAALQMFGRRPPGLALVQPGSTRDLVHVRMILTGLAPEIQRRSAGLQHDLSQKRRLEAGMEATRAQIRLQEENLRAQRLALVQLEIAHRRASVRLSEGAIVAQDRAIAMGEDARDIADLIGQMEVEAAQQAALARLPGPVMRPLFPGLVARPPAERVESEGRLPFRLPVAGALLIGFGELEESGARSRGLTLRAGAGAQLVAPAAGRVVFAGPFRRYNHIVIIGHGRGWTSLITNLGTLQVQVGQQVIAGSPIGRAAAGGRGITVELRHGGQPVDITRFVE